MQKWLGRTELLVELDLDKYYTDRPRRARGEARAGTSAGAAGAADEAGPSSAAQYDRSSADESEPDFVV